MISARDVQLIQEADENSVIEIDFSDNPVAASLRRWAFDFKSIRPIDQIARCLIREFGADDFIFERYAAALRKNKFQVQLDHGFDASTGLRLHEFRICWHYAVTNGKLY